MNQFYTPKSHITDTTIKVTGPEAHHILHVMRYGMGDEIIVTDGTGGRYHARIQNIWDTGLEARITRYNRMPDNGIRSLVIAFGAIKQRSRLEIAVEKAVELGATEIVIFQSRYSERSKIRLDRLEGLILSAMKQSLRTFLPEIRYLDGIEEVLRQYDDHRIVIADEKIDRDAGIPSDILKDERLLLVVGPEGGFSTEEVNMAGQAGAIPVSLGKARLRTETAVIVFLAQFIGI